MPIHSAQVTDNQKDAILDLREGHFSDLKSIDISPAKLSRSISAFANASGGELYIGIDETNAGELFENRSWRGFPSQESANGHLQAFEELFPLGEYFSYTFLTHPGSPGLVLQVEVRKSRDITKASNGIAYLRRGAENLPQETEEKLARLRLDKGIVSFETETVGVDVASISNSVPLLEFLVNVVPTAEPEPWLSKQQLLIGGKPTVAAVLLFADEPQAILPKRCGIKIYRHKTASETGSRETLAFDPITIEGHLYSQIKTAVQRTVDLVEDIQKLGPKGLEPVSYPNETLHEIVTNAVLHRDYSLATDVHIRIFDNRIEVESPGRLPGHITVQNILSEQFARNGAIVRLINKFPDAPNKDVGEGLNTAFKAMSMLRLKPPTIEERENSVVLFIRHEPLASPEETVMAYLDTHPEIVNRVGRSITGIQSENSMKNVFIRLRQRGKIEPVPGREGFASAWRKKTVPPSN